MKFRSENEELTLRDHLAIGRTILANERTFLAYLRTALATFLAGISLIKFFNSAFIQLIGWFLLPAGLITIIFGWLRFRKQKVSIPEKYKINMNRRSEKSEPVYFNNNYGSRSESAKRRNQSILS